MENPQFTPQLVFPSEGQPIVRADDLVSPESNLTPLYIRTTSDQASENQTLEQSIELPITQNFQRRGITAGERQTLLAWRNLQFESKIGRKHMGSTDETPTVDGDPTQSTVINLGASGPTPAHHTTPLSQPSDANASDFTTILTTFCNTEHSW